ncbi:MAG: hypothetical protein GY906_23110 [bacterium]|nr:hypothetical protein [bacterium]
MSKLAHTHQSTMDKIEAEALAQEGIFPCERCDGTGSIAAPFSGSDPSCPDCDGEGLVYGWPGSGNTTALSIALAGRLSSGTIGASTSQS